MHEKRHTYLITGGAGFIGANYVSFLLARDAEASVRVLDKLSYSGTLASLSEHLHSHQFQFIQADICSRDAVAAALEGVDYVVNFAAEVAVDRSIIDPEAFLRTGISGVYSLLEEARRRPALKRFLQVSTDEVYGSTVNGRFSEASPVKPRNPYSAVKLSGEMLALSYCNTYGVPVVVTRATNTYGPKAHPEKVIPLFITNLMDGQPLPLYGDGQQVRDWLYVEDHCSAIHTVLHEGENGKVYNISANQEYTNLELTRQVLRLLGSDESMIRFVNDRPGHDRRYSVSAERLRGLGWVPRYDLEKGLKETVDWYGSNESWWRPLKDGLDKRYESGFWGAGS